MKKENDVSVGNNKKQKQRDIHGGYDPKAWNKRWQSTISKGNVYTKELCEKLDVPYKQIGALVVAFSEEEKENTGRIKTKRYHKRSS